VSMGLPDEPPASGFGGQSPSLMRTRSQVRSAADEGASLQSLGFEPSPGEPADKRRWFIDLA
jgi:hypothetical protein